MNVNSLLKEKAEKEEETGVLNPIQVDEIPTIKYDDNSIDNAKALSTCLE